MRIDKAVKVMMIERGVSAFEMAKGTGLDRSTIFRTVGEGANPKLNNLAKCAKVLNVKVSDIILLAEKYGDENDNLQY